MTRFFLFVFFILLNTQSAYATTWEMGSALNIHGSLRGKSLSALPQKVLIPNGYVVVSETTSSDVDEIDPSWSKNAEELIHGILTTFLENEIGIEIVSMPALSSTQKHTIDQHVDLFELILFEYIDIKDSWHPAWQHKRDNMDLTVGPGLSFLKASNADSVLVVLGEQNQTRSYKRKDASQPGSSYITFGLIELETGNVIWTNTILSSYMNFQADKDVLDVIESAFKVYPRY